MRTIVITWAGQHDRALAIRQAIVNAGYDCLIVWSDPQDAVPFPEGVAHLRRPDDLFWGDKFLAAISSGDPDEILIVQADCQCGKWGALVQKARAAFARNEDLAVWSPFVLGTPYPLARTLIEDIGSSGLKRVAQTDGLVFVLRRDVVERMRELDYSENSYGWGIDWVYIAAAEAKGGFAAVDPSILVRHKTGRGYPEGPAAEQMRKFLAQMTADETKAYIRLSKHVLRGGGRTV